jgi:hypothetical protein
MARLTADFQSFQRAGSECRYCSNRINPTSGSPSSATYCSAVVADGGDPGTAVSCLLAGLPEGRQAALLVEAPSRYQFQRCGISWRLLGKAHDGEANRPRSAGRERALWRAIDRHVEAFKAASSG